MSRKSVEDFIQALEDWIRMQNNFVEGFDPEANEFNVPEDVAAKFPCPCVCRECMGWNRGEGPYEYRGWVGEFVIRRDDGGVWAHTTCGTKSTK